MISRSLVTPHTSHSSWYRDHWSLFTKYHYTYIVGKITGPLSQYREDHWLPFMTYERLLVTHHNLEKVSSHFSKFRKDPLSLFKIRGRFLITPDFIIFSPSPWLWYNSWGCTEAVLFSALLSLPWPGSTPGGVLLPSMVVGGVIMVVWSRFITALLGD